LQHRLDAVEKRAGVEARVQVDGLVELPPSVEEGLYRIAQEALNNSLKHAAATLVTVRIETGDDMVELAVADNGRGFDPHSLQDGGGMGLPNMRERAERLGGSLAILSKPGAGATIRASLPTRRSWSRPVLPIDRMSEVV
jgi:signal transduction histidine kinase